MRRVEWVLYGLALIPILQMVPLPRAVIGFISPAALELEGMLQLTPSSPMFRPLTIRTAETAWASAVLLGAVAFFQTALGVTAHGGLRHLTRIVCAGGLIVSVFAAAQAAVGARAIYGVYYPPYDGPLPFGPFVNRNHFATWVAMALPLAFGYIAARLDAPGTDRSAPRHVRARARRRLEHSAAWPIACAGAMLGALLLTLSRSGLLSVVLTGLAGVGLSWQRMHGSHRRALLVAAVIVGSVGLWWADLRTLEERALNTAQAVEGRTRIWQETVPILRDFPLVGTGAGTFQSAMLAYQTSSRTWFINQAHNHYLQAAAEGGLLLVMGVLVAVTVFVPAAARRLGSERGGIAWLRMGAAGGLVAAAIQSFWETGLTMPANAALAALLAAILVHERPTAPEGDHVAPDRSGHRWRAGGLPRGVFGDGQ